MKKCYYIDAFATGHTHEVFNAALLEMLTRLFGEGVVCRTSRSSFAHIGALMPREALDRVEYRPLYVPEGGGRWSMLVRYLFCVGTTLRALRDMPRGALAVIPYNNALALRPINLLNRICRRRILICCHGELEWLTDDAMPEGVLNRLLARRVRRFFRGRFPLARGLFFGILGDGPKRRLGAFVPTDRADRFVAFDHPCPAADGVPSAAGGSSARLRIRTVGALNRQKGSESLIRFAEALPASCRDRLDIRTGAVLGVSEERLEKLGVHVLQTTGPKSRSQLLAELVDADYLLFLYSEDYYKVTASGAIMDALVLGKKVLSLRNDYFDYLFDRVGSFGIMERTPEELADRVSDILEGRIEVPEPDFEAIRSVLSPGTVARRLRGELERVGLIGPTSGRGDDAALRDNPRKSHTDK